jgi:hypothetical protein
MNKYNDSERTYIEAQALETQAMEQAEPKQVAWQYAFAGLGALGIAGYLHMHGDNLGATVFAACLSICFAVASFREPS